MVFLLFFAAPVLKQSTMEYPPLDYEATPARDLMFHYLNKENFKSTQWGFLHLTLSFHRLSISKEDGILITNPDNLTVAEKDIARAYVQSDEYWMKPASFEVLDYLRIPENASQVLESLAWFRLELLPIFTNLFLPDTALAREELHRHVALEHFIARGMTFRNDRLILLIAFLFIAFYLTYFLLTKGVKIHPAKHSNNSCFLRNLPDAPLNKCGEHIDMYLIDTIALRTLLSNCSAALDLPIAVLISEKDSGASLNSSLYYVTIFEDKGDFLQLNSTPPRVLLKQDFQRIGSILIPMDLRKFIDFYERSRLIPCLN
ncbi:hypothetical protein PRIPAC_71895 [Pristionchus pacificus]|uniref:W02B3.4-like N-terminal domain-containing protein n=1 Tax=Pristionchus pacificus TaxID=54126 RepID=A0A8R1YFK2_PRIPA|nr:hypothetical protein PRIPAC_71895 [Pristionchus pacificus]|eukprot:PDM77027.1 hypothetical protein PRIPAC_42422 [Pristionchus pacificus]